jgi:hypothetical protein
MAAAAGQRMERSGVGPFAQAGLDEAFGLPLVGGVSFAVAAFQGYLVRGISLGAVKG